MQVKFLCHDSLETDYKDLGRRGKQPTPALPYNPLNWDQTNKGKFMFVSTETFFYSFLPIRQMIHASNIIFK